MASAKNRRFAFYPIVWIYKINPISKQLIFQLLGGPFWAKEAESNDTDGRVLHVIHSGL